VEKLGWVMIIENRVKKSFATTALEIIAMNNKVTHHFNENKNLIFWFIFGVIWSHIITDYTTIPTWISIITLALVILVVQAIRKNV